MLKIPLDGRKILVLAPRGEMLQNKGSSKASMAVCHLPEIGCQEICEGYSWRTLRFLSWPARGSMLENKGSPKASMAICHLLDYQKLAVRKIA